MLSTEVMFGTQAVAVVVRQSRFYHWSIDSKVITYLWSFSRARLWDILHWIVIINGSFPSKTNIGTNKVRDQHPGIPRNNTAPLLSRHQASSSIHQVEKNLYPCLLLDCLCVRVCGGIHFRYPVWRKNKHFINLRTYRYTDISFKKGWQSPRLSLWIFGHFERVPPTVLASVYGEVKCGHKHSLSVAYTYNVRW